MPQLDIFIFFTLMFWFLILFELSHYFFVKWFLPNLMGIFFYRKFLFQSFNIKANSLRLEKLAIYNKRINTVQVIFTPCAKFPNLLTTFRSNLIKDIASREKILNNKFESSSNKFNNMLDNNSNNMFLTKKADTPENIALDPFDKTWHNFTNYNRINNIKFENDLKNRDKVKFNQSEKILAAPHVSHEKK